MFQKITIQSTKYQFVLKITEDDRRLFSSGFQYHFNVASVIIITAQILITKTAKKLRDKSNVNQFPLLPALISQ